MSIYDKYELNATTMIQIYSITMTEIKKSKTPSCIFGKRTLVKEFTNFFMEMVY